MARNWVALEQNSQKPSNISGQMREILPIGSEFFPSVLYLKTFLWEGNLICHIKGKA
jgi:hypothetical protein